MTLYSATIGGMPVTGEADFSVWNPPTGREAGRAPNMGAADLDRAVAAARAAFPEWSACSDGELQRRCSAVTSRIEEHADRILEEVGFEIRGDQEAVDLFRKAGAETDGWRIRPPRGLIRSIIQASCPASFVQHARNPERSVVIGGPNTVFSPAYGSPFVSDAERGRRYGTLEDFGNFVRLAYLTPWLHHSGGTVCEPVDVPVNKRHLDMVLAHMTLSDKAFMGSVTTAPRAADSIEMCRAQFEKHRSEGTDQRGHEYQQHGGDHFLPPRPSTATPITIVVMPRFL